jgi:hypothetical protein
MKKKSEKRKTKNPNGRPSVHGEPTAMFSARIPLSVLEVADAIGPTRAMGLIAMAKQSVEYPKAGNYPAASLSVVPAIKP